PHYVRFASPPTKANSHFRLAAFPSHDAQEHEVATGTACVVWIGIGIGRDCAVVLPALRKHALLVGSRRLIPVLHNAQPIIATLPGSREVGTAQHATDRMIGRVARGVGTRVCAGRSCQQAESDRQDQPSHGSQLDEAGHHLPPSELCPVPTNAMRTDCGNVFRPIKCFTPDNRLTVGTAGVYTRKEFLPLRRPETGCRSLSVQCSACPLKSAHPCAPNLGRVT